MYTNQILIYLIWPVFIAVSWLIIRAAVILYEKRQELSSSEGSKKE